MKIKLQIIIEYENSKSTTTQEIACLTRSDLLPESLGMTLAESKDLLAKMQEEIVHHQVAQYIQQHRSCTHCGSKHSLKCNGQ